MAYNTKLVARFITSLERIERAFPPIFRKLILIGRVRLDVKLSALAFSPPHYAVIAIRAIRYTLETLIPETL
jgi:hypothetical protein